MSENWPHFPGNVFLQRLPFHRISAGAIHWVLILEIFILFMKKVTDIIFPTLIFVKAGCLMDLLWKKLCYRFLWNLEDVLISWRTISVQISVAIQHKYSVYRLKLRAKIPISQISGKQMFKKTSSSVCPPFWCIWHMSPFLGHDTCPPLWVRHMSPFMGQAHVPLFFQAQFLLTILKCFPINVT